LSVSRWCLVIPRSARTRKLDLKEEKCTSLIVLGSGGHTMEMLELVKNLDVERYCPVHVVVAETDKTSLPKLKSSNKELTDVATIHYIRRSREVGQSFKSSVFTTLRASVDAVRLVFSIKPNLILCNGPGTCVPICVGGLLMRFLGMGDPCIIFTESLCRVKSLSLTGRLLYFIADRFVVHWPQLVEQYPRAEYIGVLF